MSSALSWSDEALVAAITEGGAGRERALQWWFGQESLQIWVRQYAVQHGGSEADGEDLYHDTFITFDRLLREGKFRGESALKTFFCAIAKWQWLNAQRKKGKEIAVDSAALPEEAMILEEDLYDRERQSLFQTMFAALGDKCKRVLTLYQLSYSMKEIAQEMGWSSDQVATNQSSTCRKKLKALIENSIEIKDFLNI